MVTRKQTAAKAEGATDQFGLFPDVELPEPYKKAVSAVHMAPRERAMTLQQYRVFDALLKHATDQYKVDSTRIWYTISIGDLSKKIGLENSNNTRYIKAIIDELVTFGVNWDYLAGLNKGEWNSSALLAGAKISKGGMLNYHYADNLRELFMNPEIWAWIDFRIMNRFSKAVTAPVYQNVLRYAGIGKTPVLSVDVWRDLIVGMEWRKGSYAEYKEFKRAVLLKALDEINTKSDHNFELIEIKEGRAISALQFLVKEKVKQEVIEPSDLELITSVKKLGVPYSEARKLLAKFGPDAVTQAVRYVEQRMTSKLASLESVPAYFRNALNKGYTLGSPLVEKATAALSSKESVTSTSEEVLALFAADRRAESRRYFLELEPGEQAALIDRYNEQQETALLKITSAAKMKKASETAFFTWLGEDTWGTPTDSDVLQFVMTKAKVSV
ncbi:DNA-binding transcriptional MerR regulator [Paraburkholderia sp. GAS448]|uniref:RepB family plasmid replication initiator protein n=1 Tax=Paraburkholderia sp. GAS448 TaxID=3035136 RepID=UPI003D227997